jgi:hypothetical protein
MDIAIVTTAKTDEEAKELLTLMGAPFSRAWEEVRLHGKKVYDC